MDSIDDTRDYLQLTVIEILLFNYRRAACSTSIICSGIANWMSSRVGAIRGSLKTTYFVIWIVHGLAYLEYLISLSHASIFLASVHTKEYS